MALEKLTSSIKSLPDYRSCFGHGEDGEGKRESLPHRFGHFDDTCGAFSVASQGKRDESGKYVARGYDVWMFGRPYIRTLESLLYWNGPEFWLQHSDIAAIDFQQD